MSAGEQRLNSTIGQPTWEVALLLPNQGSWDESEFLSLPTNRMAELVNGRLEVLPMPSWLHQLIVDFFLDSIKAYLRDHQRGGKVLFAPLPTKLFPGTIREPDVLYAAPDHVPRNVRRYPERLDFVVEVVSEGEEARIRDYDDKRSDYARAGIAEYWIVDPQDRTITVLCLVGDAYETHGCFRAGEFASGRYFEGFSVDVSSVFALENPEQPPSD